MSRRERMRRQKIQYWLAQGVVLASVGAVVLVLTILFGCIVRVHAEASVSVGMDELYEGYYICWHDLERESACYLEYDGDGGSNTPADYHWYWR